MGSAAAEFGLDFKLCAMRTVGGFLKEAAAAVQSSDGGVAKLENSVRSLEEERRKIEAFKRELPLCMLLLTDGGDFFFLPILGIYFQFLW